MDNPEAGLLLVLILLFIFANGFFSLTETAITESHKSRLEKLADDGVSDALEALKILEAPEKILSVVQIGITLMSILVGMTTGALLAPYAARFLDFLPYADTIALIGSVLLITYINLLLGEFLPKKIALQTPETYLMKFQGLLTGWSSSHARRLLSFPALQT